MNEDLTTEEVARFLRVSPVRVRAMIAQDLNPKRHKTHFPHAKRCACGQAWIIPASDLKVKKDRP